MTASVLTEKKSKDTSRLSREMNTCFNQTKSQTLISLSVPAGHYSAKNAGDMLQLNTCAPYVCGFE